MEALHIAFIVESAYGHIVPTLGMARQLLRRGHRVSYAVRESFERKIRQFGAEAVVYKPLDNKLKVFRESERRKDIDPSELKNLAFSLHAEEVNDTFLQLKRLYGRDEPDLIVYDIMNPAGRTLAKSLGVRAVEHSPLLISRENEDWRYDDNLVLVSIPRFFQPNAQCLDERFRFIGLVEDGRKFFFDPWPAALRDRETILIYATTGLLPQVEFLKTAIAAFGDSARQLVLTIGDDTELESLAPLPDNCRVNRSSSNMEILEFASLVVAQGGTGSTLEGMYHGVPQVLVPPPFRVFEECADRLAELGLGVCIRPSRLTTEGLREAGLSLMRDAQTQSRLKDASMAMHKTDGAAIACDLLEGCLRSV